ncbi:MAG: hypothetical protein M1823_006179, partial [Watsoniomyces obsoletus]
MVYLPPPSTHLLQPLDVGVFAPLKKEYERLMSESFKWALKNTRKSQFVENYEKARKVLTSTLISGAWKK